MPAHYEIYKDDLGKYRFNLRAENNKIVAISQAYKQYISCIKGVASVKKNYGSAIEDLTTKGTRIPNPKYQVIYDDDHKYGFHLLAKNGAIIAEQYGFGTKKSCLNGIQAVKDCCDAEIEGIASEPIPAPVVEVKEPIPAPVVEVKELKTPSPLKIVDTQLELYDLPQSVEKGTIVAIRGKLSNRETGVGIPSVKIDIREDSSFLGSKWLASGNTNDDGSFSINWKAYRVDWWDNTAEIYAEFLGAEKATSSKTSIKQITLL